MPEYTGNNPMILSSLIHAETDADFLATGYKAKITSLLDSGNAAHLSTLKNHVGREYFSKLYELGKSASITDPYDSGFRPTAVTGLYA